MAAQPQYGGAMPEVSPPQRRSFAPDGQNQRQPEPAWDVIWLRNGQEPMTMNFLYSPNHSMDWKIQEWAAFIYVTCSAFSHPICKGFHWGGANVVHEDVFVGEVVMDGEFGQDEKKWSGVRHYLLEDLLRPRRWVAKLQVFTFSYETLRHFDLNQLSQENIRYGQAFCPYGRRIYQYCYGKFQPCYNTIYGDMPMEGFWPRPRMIPSIDEW
ncbi:hypothetical protein F4782DRAFT_530753 [Xylaria castorea]|nr:hypothetical protein F4782DRAFT_530753 [Xylaria castorea]